ncbi:MAG: VOC family protein [Acidobacteria bacterium]|nr:VOC family protein [Acidobacteriota bacterium]
MSLSYFATSLCFFVLGGPAQTAAPTYFAIHTRQLDVQKVWYQKWFGLDVASEMNLPDGGKIVLLKKGNTLIEILQLKDATPKAQAAGNPLGIFKTGIWIEGLDRLFNAMKAEKADLITNVFEEEKFAFRSFIVRDPDGNFLQFLEAKK